MRYEKFLSKDGFLQEARQTHEIWGGKMDFTDRCNLLLRRMEEMGGDHFFSGLIDDNETLMASLKRYYYGVKIRNRVVNCIGLGAVFTNPDYRRRGLAEKLISMVLADSKENFGCELAMLYSDIDPQYYAKQGFRAAPARGWETTKQHLPTSGCLTLVSVQPEDADRVRALYHANTQSFAIRTERSAKVWKLFHEMNGAGPTFLLTDGGTEVGYLTVSWEREISVYVHEWMAPAAMEDRVWATVGQIATDMLANHIAGWATPNVLKPPGAVTPRKAQLPMLCSLAGPELFSDEDLQRSYFASPDHF